MSLIFLKNANGEKGYKWKNYMNNTIEIKKNSQVALVNAAIDVDDALLNGYEDLTEFLYNFGIGELNYHSHIYKEDSFLAEGDGEEAVLSAEAIATYLNKCLNRIGVNAGMMRLGNDEVLNNVPNGWASYYDEATNRVNLWCGQRQPTLRLSRGQFMPAPTYNFNYPHNSLIKSPNFGGGTITDEPVVAIGQDDVGWCAFQRDLDDDDNFACFYNQDPIRNVAGMMDGAIAQYGGGIVIFKPTYDPQADADAENIFYFGIQARCLMDNTELTNPAHGNGDNKFTDYLDLNGVVPPAPFHSMSAGLVLVRVTYTSGGPTSRGNLQCLVNIGTHENSDYRPVGPDVQFRTGLVGAVLPFVRMSYSRQSAGPVDMTVADGNAYQLIVESSTDYDETGDSNNGTWDLMFDMASADHGVPNPAMPFYIPSWLMDIVPVVYLKRSYTHNNPGLTGGECRIRGVYSGRIAYGADGVINKGIDLIGGVIPSAPAMVSRPISKDQLQNQGIVMPYLQRIAKQLGLTPEVDMFGNPLTAYNIDTPLAWGLLSPSPYIVGSFPEDKVCQCPNSQGTVQRMGDIGLEHNKKNHSFCFGVLKAIPTEPRQIFGSFVNAGAPMLPLGQLVTNFGQLMGFPEFFQIRVADPPPVYADEALSAWFGDSAPWAPQSGTIRQIHIQLPTLTLHSFNAAAGRLDDDTDIGTGGRKVKDIAIVPLTEQFQGYINALQGTQTLVYEPKNVWWLDLQNEMTFKTTDFDVYITYDNNTPAVALTGKSSITIMIREKPATTVAN